MFASEAWTSCRYASTLEGSAIEEAVLTSNFWDNLKEVVEAITRFYKVLRVMYDEK